MTKTPESERVLDSDVYLRDMVKVKERDLEAFMY